MKKILILKLFIVLTGLSGLVINQIDYTDRQMTISNRTDKADSIIILQETPNSLNPIILMIDPRGTPSTVKLSLPWHQLNQHVTPNLGDMVYGIFKDDPDHAILITYSKYTNALRVFHIESKTMDMQEVKGDSFGCRLNDIYACRVSRDNKNHQCYAFLLGKSGKIEQWQISADNNKSIRVEFVGFIQTEA
jgi:myo-inositol-hexaphosphate 3-phosphohydrolase